MVLGPISFMVLGHATRFFTTEMAPLPLAFRPVSYLSSSDGTTSLSAFVGQQGQPPPPEAPHQSTLSGSFA